MKDGVSCLLLGNFRKTSRELIGYFIQNFVYYEKYGSSKDGMVCLMDLKDC